MEYINNLLPIAFAFFGMTTVITLFYGGEAGSAFGWLVVCVSSNGVTFIVLKRSYQKKLIELKKAAQDIAAPTAQIIRALPDKAILINEERNQYAFQNTQYQERKENALAINAEIETKLRADLETSNSTKAAALYQTALKGMKEARMGSQEWKAWNRIKAVSHRRATKMQNL